MTYDGTAPMGDAVAVGPKVVSGPAGVPDARPAPQHHLTFPAAHSGRAGPGYRQRCGGAASARTKKEVPMA
jgi:hypothetical protein